MYVSIGLTAVAPHTYLGEQGGKLRADVPVPQLQHPNRGGRRGSQLGPAGGTRAHLFAGSDDEPRQFLGLNE